MFDAPAPEPPPQNPLLEMLSKQMPFPQFFGATEPVQQIPAWQASMSNLADQWSRNSIPRGTRTERNPLLRGLQEGPTSSWNQQDWADYLNDLDRSSRTPHTWSNQEWDDAHRQQIRNIGFRDVQRFREEQGLPSWTEQRR